MLPPDLHPWRTGMLRPPSLPAGGLAAPWRSGARRAAPVYHHHPAWGCQHLSSPKQGLPDWCPSHRVFSLGEVRCGGVGFPTRGTCEWHPHAGTAPWMSGPARPALRPGNSAHAMPGDGKRRRRGRAQRPQPVGGAWGRRGSLAAPGRAEGQPGRGGSAWHFCLSAGSRVAMPALPFPRQYSCFHAGTAVARLRRGCRKRMSVCFENEKTGDEGGVTLWPLNPTSLPAQGPAGHRPARRAPGGDRGVGCLWELVWWVMVPRAGSWLVAGLFLVLRVSERWPDSRLVCLQWCSANWIYKVIK